MVVALWLFFEHFQWLQYAFAHLGVSGCLRRARESLFWPGMTSDLKEYISTCEICSKYQTNNQPETLMPHDLPERPWEKVEIDLFTLQNHDYLITVDYFSNFGKWTVLKTHNLPLSFGN